MKTALCYFSATGNTFEIACRLQKKMSNCDIIPMMHANNTALSSYDAIGILSPVYNLGLPEIADNFIKNLILNQSTYYFLIITYGTSTGNTLVKACKAFKWKNQKLHYTAHIKMPNNHFRLNNFNTQTNKHKKLFSHINKRVINIAKDLFNRKENKPYLSLNPFGGIIHDTTSKRLGRISKEFTVTGLCSGCGKCNEICPTKNIHIKNQLPIFSDACIGCLSCYYRCPKKAINICKLTDSKTRYINPNINPEMMDIKIIPGKY